METPTMTHFKALKRILPYIEGFVFYIGDTIFTWSSNKQSIVTLSTCKAEYVATRTCVYHFTWLRRLLKEL